MKTSECIPNAVKFNGRFFKRYEASRFHDPGVSPTHQIHELVFDGKDDALTSTNELRDAFKYRGAYFVSSNVSIDDAVDLGELIAPPPDSLPNTPIRK